MDMKWWISYNLLVEIDNARWVELFYVLRGRTWVLRMESHSGILVRKSQCVYFHGTSFYAMVIRYYGYDIMNTELWTELVTELWMRDNIWIPDQFSITASEVQLPSHQVSIHITFSNFSTL